MICSRPRQYDRLGSRLARKVGSESSRDPFAEARMRPQAAEFAGEIGAQIRLGLLDFGDELLATVNQGRIRSLSR